LAAQETKHSLAKEKVMNITQDAPSSQSSRRVELEDFDLVILGGGTGSTIAAWTFASEGKRVAVVERKYIGGSCPNIACLPSKNIIHSAKVASLFRRSKEFGIAHNGFVIDMSGVRERKRAMVHSLNDVYLDNYARTGAEFILGNGRFVAPRTVEVALSEGGTRQLRGTNVIVSTGTRTNLDMIPGLRHAQPLTHIEALELDKVPEHLIVMGSGYIGVEFAQAMQRFGSRVSVISRRERLMPAEDEDVSDALRVLLEDEGIDVLLRSSIHRVSGKSGDTLNLAIGQNGSEKTIKGSHLLVATGRTPNTEALGLDLAGVELDDRGYIKVNERLQTTASGVWAIGEVAGSPQFTHISVDDFRVVRDNLKGVDHATTDRQVPYCLFTDPELARIGLNETEARIQGVSYRLFKVPMDSNFRARTVSETRGFVKALVEIDGDRILGFAAFGTGAAEIMTAVQIAMIAGLPYTALRDAVLTHPTLVEGLIPLFSSMPSIHEMTPEQTEIDASPMDGG
jgi:pyruvate/2-oxoglutarate dehydrogenase complex dihydrolipoamide dehydrogenase (E3) component